MSFVFRSFFPVCCLLPLFLSHPSVSVYRQPVCSQSIHAVVIHNLPTYLATLGIYHLTRSRWWLRFVKRKARKERNGLGRARLGSCGRRYGDVARQGNAR
ncbi:hypothetical protein F4814DRAFT_403045 [Daldinia grandis]|nr:hypothetical protein F4814DRAFT_403045 [Daldinia grandis]